MKHDTAVDQSAGQLWQQLAAQRLRLQDTVSINSLNYRGQTWYVLRNQLNHEQMRVNERTYQILSRLDGQQTLAEVTEPFLGDDTDLAIRQGLIGALLQLHAADMLSSDSPRNLQALVAERQRRQRQKALSRWFRLLSPRLPLVDPDQFLGRTVRWVNWMLHPAMLVIWLLFVLSAGLAALMHWDALALYGAQRIDDPRSWLLLVGLYPLIKVLHELGHGYIAKAAGAEVNEMGVTFLVFVPVPYVDASEATVIPNKHQRMLVGAAGIIVELLLASAALFIWLSVSDGLVRDLAFAIMLIGGISTLLFNGNPLLRFDGYYVFSDAIEIPNLATRSARYYGYLFKRYLLGLRPIKAPATVSGERPWFLVYGAASTAYRLTIMIAIAVFLFNTIPVLGGMLALWLLTVQVLLPLARQLHFLLFNQILNGKRLRAWLRTGTLVAVLIILVAFVPLPSRTLVEGIVLMPERAVIRAEQNGFLQEQTIADNTPVKQGEVLFRLSDPQLDAEIAELKARVQEYRARRDAYGLDQRIERDIQSQRLAEAQADLANLQQRRNSLTLVSPVDGVVRIILSSDDLGRFIRQGDLLAYVSSQDNARIRVAATQKDAVKIRDAVNHISVRMADQTVRVLSGELLQEVPAGSDRLPSPALGSRGGGSILVDGRDEQGLKTLQNIYAFDITVPYSASTEFIGRRTLVRFDHPAMPTFSGLKDDVRRFFLDKLQE